MTRTTRRFFFRASIVPLLVMASHAQGPQRGRGDPRAPGGFTPAPLIQNTPKPAIANAKPARSRESLAIVALPNTTIESAAVDPNNAGVCRVTAITTQYKGSGSADDAINFTCSTGLGSGFACG